MNFWKSFFNQPILWLLGAGVVLISCLIVQLAPQLLGISAEGNDILGSGLTMERQISADEFQETGDEVSVSQFGCGYVMFSGGFIGKAETMGMISHFQGRYHTGVAGIITAMLLLGVVIITRRSNSSVFILGPLLVAWIISLIMMVQASSSAGGIRLAYFSMFLGWLMFSLITSLTVWIVARYVLAGWGLIRGIDEYGPLDFSGLKQVAVTATATIRREADRVGEKLQQTIGEGVGKLPPLSSNERIVVPPTEKESTSLDASPPIVKPIGNLAIYCHRCGQHPLRGWGDNRSCSRCKAAVGVVIPKPELGFCPNCGSPLVYRAEFCYRCGLHFGLLN